MVLVEVAENKLGQTDLSVQLLRLDSIMSSVEILQMDGVGYLKVSLTADETQFDRAGLSP